MALALNPISINTITCDNLRMFILVRSPAIAERLTAPPP
jgi:hypothetical protein